MSGGKENPTENQREDWSPALIEFEKRLLSDDFLVDLSAFTAGALARGEQIDIDGSEGGDVLIEYDKDAHGAKDRSVDKAVLAARDAAAAATHDFDRSPRRSPRPEGGGRPQSYNPGKVQQYFRELLKAKDFKPDQINSVIRSQLAPYTYLIDAEFDKIKQIERGDTGDKTGLAALAATAKQSIGKTERDKHFAEIERLESARLTVMRSILEHPEQFDLESGARRKKMSGADFLANLDSNSYANAFRHEGYDVTDFNALFTIVNEALQQHFAEHEGVADLFSKHLLQPKITAYRAAQKSEKYPWHQQQAILDSLRAELAEMIHDLVTDPDKYADLIRTGNVSVVEPAARTLEDSGLTSANRPEDDQNYKGQLAADYFPQYRLRMSPEVRTELNKKRGDERDEFYRANYERVANRHSEAVLTQLRADYETAAIGGSKKGVFEDKAGFKPVTLIYMEGKRLLEVAGYKPDAALSMLAPAEENLMSLSTLRRSMNKARKEKGVHSDEVRDIFAQISAIESHWCQLVHARLAQAGMLAGQETGPVAVPHFAETDVTADDGKEIVREIEVISFPEDDQDARVLGAQRYRAFNVEDVEDAMADLGIEESMTEYGEKRKTFGRALGVFNNAAAKFMEEAQKANEDFDPDKLEELRIVFDEKTARCIAALPKSKK